MRSFPLIIFGQYLLSPLRSRLKDCVFRTDLLGYLKHRFQVGWDPIFEPVESSGKTFGEMSKDEKNAISHRGRALKLVVEHLSQDKKLKT